MIKILLLSLLVVLAGCSVTVNPETKIETEKLDLVIQAQCWEAGTKYIAEENRKSSNNYMLVEANYKVGDGVCYAYTKLFEPTMLLNGDPAPSYIYTIWNVTQRESMNYIIMHDIVRDEWSNMDGDLNKEKWDELLKQYFE